MLLKGHRFVRAVGEEPEVVVAVQVHLAVDGLAQRVDGIFLRLDVVLQILQAAAAGGGLLLERFDAPQQLRNHHLLLGDLGAQDRNIVLLRRHGTGAGDEQNRRQ